MITDESNDITIDINAEYELELVKESINILPDKLKIPLKMFIYD